MPDINMSAFEEVQRNQLVTEVDIQTQVALDDYQVQLSNIANPTQSQDNVVIDRFGEFLPHWNESLDFDTWVKMSMEVAGKLILILRGKSNVSSASNGNDVFELFDDFEVDLSKWTQTGASVSNGIVTVAAGSGNNIASIATFGQNYAYRGKVKAAHFSTQNYNPMIGFRINSGSGAVMTFYNYPNVGEFQMLTQSDTGSNTGTNMVAPSDDEYHIFDLIRNGNTNTQLAIDDGTPVINTANIPSVQTSVIIRTEGSSSEALYGDWVLVRKYTATEPIWIADDEQNIAVALKSLGRAG